MIRIASALLVHPDSRFRTNIGQLTRSGRNPVFLAADAEEARRLMDEHPSVRVVAVAPSAGGRRLLESLVARRPGATGLLISDEEEREAVGTGLDRRIVLALDALELRRERRLHELLNERMRARAASTARRLSSERRALTERKLEARR